MGKINVGKDDYIRDFLDAYGTWSRKDTPNGINVEVDGIDEAYDLGYGIGKAALLEVLNEIKTDLDSNMIETARERVKKAIDKWEF